MRRSVLLAMAIVCASQWGGTDYSARAANGTTAPQFAAALMVGDRLVDLAYSRSKTQGNASRVSSETLILLQLAHDADPKNLHTTRLLAEAANRAGDSVIRRAALRDLISQDSSDLVAQVAYLDMIATATQAIDARAKVYRAALDQTTLNTQIRSEMAQRLAQIAYERGDRPSAQGFLQQSLSLNSVNTSALRLAVTTAQSDAEKTAALIGLLKANPLTPEAWLEVAEICERAHLHANATAYLTAALEQLQMKGEGSGEQYLALATQMAIAGRDVEASSILGELQKLADVPLRALATQAVLLAAHPPVATSQAASQPTTTSLSDATLTLLEQRVGDTVTKQPKSIESLSAALWIELAVMPTPGPHIDEWMKQLDPLCGDEDADLLGRLHGWRQLQKSDFSAAAETLMPLQSDPYAALGLAKALLALNKRGQAAQVLQSAWNATGGGEPGVQLLNLQIAQTASAAKISLADIGSSAGVKAALVHLPPNLVFTHRQPRESELVITSVENSAYSLGQPMMLSVQITNSSDFPLSVGPDGAIKTNVGLFGKVAGIESTNIGLVSIESLQRVYRLEPHQSISSKIRIDQGTLADYLWSHPVQPLTLSLSAIVEPRGTTDAPVPGLGGQAVAIGGVLRSGTALGTLRAYTQLLASLNTLHDAELMKAIAIIGASVGRDFAGGAAGTAAKESADAASQTTSSLIQLLANPDANIRGWTVLSMPMGVDETPPLKDALRRLSSDTSPFVRVIWAEHMAGYSDHKDAASQLTAASALPDGGIAQIYLKQRAADLE